MPFWPFRSTSDHIAELRKARGRGADHVIPGIGPGEPWPFSPAEPTPQPDHGRVYVSADAEKHVVCIRIIGLGYFDMTRAQAFAFAKNVDGAADALGPEPPKPDDSAAIDITADVEAKDE